MKKCIVIFVMLAVFFCQKVNAQKNYNFSNPFWFNLDLLRIEISEMKTQNQIQDSFLVRGTLREHVMQYFEVKGDTLYAVFPRDYEVYLIDNPLTGEERTSNKEMIIYKELVPYKRRDIKKAGYAPVLMKDMLAKWDSGMFRWKSITVYNFRTRNILGKRVNICPTNKKGIVYLSL